MSYTINIYNYYRQHSIKKRAIRILLSLGILLIGGLIYAIYRTKSLLMFNWFDSVGISSEIDGHRRLIQSDGIWGWVKYSLPDGLWLFSYMFIVDAIWDKERNSVSKMFLWILPIVAVLSECFQSFGLLPGEFDWMDLVSYMLAMILFLITKLLNY